MWPLTKLALEMVFQTSHWRNPTPQKEETSMCKQSVVCSVPCWACWIQLLRGHLNLTTIWGKYCPYFTDEGTKAQRAQRLSNLPKAAQLPRGFCPDLSGFNVCSFHCHLPTD